MGRRSSKQAYDRVNDNTCSLNWQLIEELTPQPPFAKNSPRIALLESIKQFNTVYDQVQQQLDTLAETCPQTAERFCDKRFREIGAALEKPLNTATRKSATVKSKTEVVCYATELLQELLTELQKFTPEDLARQECALSYQDDPEEPYDPGENFYGDSDDVYNPNDPYDIDTIYDLD